MSQILNRLLEIIPEEISSRLVLAGLRGSHVHGTYIDPEEEHGTDDIDVFGITVMPLSYYLGVDSWNKLHDTLSKGGPEQDIDYEIHELRKFMFLLEKGNPNVHSHLWIDPKYYVHISPGGKILIDRRKELLSQKLFSSLSGYAYAQLQRMQNKSKQGYMGEKRFALVEKYGYDIKNAAHCIRLLYMGLYLVERNELVIRLPDMELNIIKGIKTGKYSLNEVTPLALQLFELFNAAKTNSNLPKYVTREVTNDICMQVMRETFHFKL